MPPTFKPDIQRILLENNYQKKLLKRHIYGTITLYGSKIPNRIQFIPEKAKAWLGSLNCKIIEDLLGENDDPF